MEVLGFTPAKELKRGFGSTEPQMNASQQAVFAQNGCFYVGEPVCVGV